MSPWPQYAAILVLLLTAGSCTLKQNPDDLREKTARATAEARRDAKAVAEGVKEGWARGKTIDLNKSSKEQLQSLPGMTPERADRIIEERPYENSHQLVTRRLITESEYNQIKDHVTVSR